MKRHWIVLAIAIFASSALAADFQVVVNASNSASSISKTTLQDFYLGKATRWSNGTAIAAVDRDEHSDVRATFSKVALGKTVANVKSYWLTIVFAGRGVPPPEHDSDEKVLDAVRRNKGGVGYVSAAAVLPNGVKALKIE